MSHDVVDQLLERTRAGQLRSPVSGNLGMDLVEFGRGEAIYEVERLRAEARVIRAGGRLVWAEADVLADGEVVGKFASTGIRVAFDPAAFVAEHGTSDE